MLGITEVLIPEKKEKGHKLHAVILDQHRTKDQFLEFTKILSHIVGVNCNEETYELSLVSTEAFETRIIKTYKEYFILLYHLAAAFMLRSGYRKRSSAFGLVEESIPDYLDHYLHLDLLRLPYSHNEFDSDLELQVDNGLSCFRKDLVDFYNLFEDDSIELDYPVRIVFENIPEALHYEYGRCGLLRTDPVYLTEESLIALKNDLDKAMIV